MKRIVGSILVISVLAACGYQRSRSSTLTDATAATIARSVSGERAGIAVVGTGGSAGLERITMLDSATARYVTVTRRLCDGGCAPIDSAAGTISRDDVAFIYAVVARENVFALGEDYGVCDSCSDQALITTVILGNRQRKVIRSDRETTPEILGRVHVAIAEAIRESRARPLAVFEQASR